MTTQPPLNGVYEYQKTIRHRSISRGAWTETGSANEENVRGPRTPTEGSDGEAGHRGCGTTIREDKHGEQETEEISVPDDKAGKASARAGSRIQRQLAPDREDFEAERKALSKSRANKVGTTHQSHIQYTGGDTRSTAAGSGESGDFNSPIASCFSPTKESGHSSNLVNDKSLGAVSAAMDPLASPSSALARLPDDEQRLTATFLSRRDLLLSLSARLKTLIPNKRGQESQQASEGALQAEVQELPPTREAGAVQRIKYSPREGNAAKRSGSPGIKTAKLQSHETLSARSGSGKHNGSDKKRTETAR
ncbi:hypothetical protein BESB_080290 [Besnoitia besnoiti]|uniref:Uncharacterized protein n=1 Tax=Besnoitia besnoiti TaxID=94643 RepID=A0A2A9MDR4_BESBE|nr:hypothetical protein BESB_080290 [Besnoitia besnoiti]PFH33813.1 hypothetical protein BESB_080290 [Besnoitia besnoiti]